MPSFWRSSNRVRDSKSSHSFFPDRQQQQQHQQDHPGEFQLFTSLHSLLLLRIPSFISSPPSKPLRCSSQPRRRRTATALRCTALHRIGAQTNLYGCFYKTSHSIVQLQAVVRLLFNELHPLVRARSRVRCRYHYVPTSHSR